MAHQAVRAKGIKLQFYPYTPNSPEVKKAWSVAHSINPNADGFIGHDGKGNLYFQETGNPEAVIVSIDELQGE